MLHRKYLKRKQDAHGACCIYVQQKRCIKSAPAGGATTCKGVKTLLSIVPHSQCAYDVSYDASLFWVIRSRSNFLERSSTCNSWFGSRVVPRHSHARVLSREEWVGAVHDQEWNSLVFQGNLLVVKLQKRRFHLPLDMSLTFWPLINNPKLAPLAKRAGV